MNSHRSFTRRTFSAAAFAAIAGSGSGRAFAQSVGTPEASPVAGTWPRVVQGTLGDVEIPAKPERVVAVSDWFEVDYLMAQGVAPVLYGYTNRYGQGVSPWLQEAGAAELEQYDLESSGEPDLEAILAAQPDLIVADPYIAEQVVSQLNAIAPTVGLPTPYTGSADWRAAQLLTGTATGDELAAGDAIGLTDQAIAAGRELLAPFADRTVTIAYTTAYNGGTLFFARDQGQEATLIRELGLQFKGHESNAPQSLEQIGALADVDILISYDNEDNQQYFENNPLFQGLPVATNGNYETITTIASRAVFAPTTLSVRWVVPQLVETLIRAANGEGKVVG